MDRFLEKFNLPRVNQEDIEIMNKPIKHWNWSCDQKSPNKQKPRTRWLHRRILSNICKELMPILLKFFQKIAEEGTLPNSFYEATITLIPKPDKDDTQKRKIQANITDEHRCKNPQQNFSKQNSATHRKAHTPWASWVYSRDARILQNMQVNQCDTPF